MPSGFEKAITSGTDTEAGTGAEEKHSDPQALLYTSETLVQDVIVAGPISVHLSATTSALDTDWFAERATAILSVEEHTIIGGFGSAVAEYLAESELLQSRRFKRIGIPDVFPSVYGDQNGMMKKYGVSAEAVVEHSLQLLKSRSKPVRIAA